MVEGDQALVLEKALGMRVVGQVRPEGSLAGTAAMVNQTHKVR